MIDGLLKNNGINDIDKNSVEYRKLCVEIHKAAIQLIPLEKRTMMGDFSYNKDLPDIFPDVFTKPDQTLPQTPKDKSSVLLNDVFDEYCKRQIQSKKWRPNTVRNHQPKINTMLQVLGNRPVNHITVEDMRKLAKLLELLPPGFARLKEL